MYSWKDRIKDWWYRVSERWELRREALAVATWPGRY
jgi:hypothetical protein